MKVIDVAREMGLHCNTIILKETTTRVELETIDKLCKLFQCQVGDLFEYVEE